MGTIYTIACRDCKVKRDLDKLHIAGIVETRTQALEYAEYLKSSEGFRVGLLASFLDYHQGHSIVFYNEHWDALEDEFQDYPEENFWTGDPDSKALKT